MGGIEHLEICHLTSARQSSISVPLVRDTIPVKLALDVSQVLYLIL